MTEWRARHKAPALLDTYLERHGGQMNRMVFALGKANSEQTASQFPMIGSLRKRLPRSLRLFLFGAMLTALMIGSLLPNLGFSDNTENNEILHGVLVHGLVYALVTSFSILIFERPFKSVATVILFSAIVEVMQSFVPWRYASLIDLAANGAGVVLGLVLMLIAAKCWPDAGGSVPTRS